jgi:Cu/Ag efflux protein CusF
MEPTESTDKNGEEQIEQAQPQIWLVLEKECQAMALHAFSKGQAVPSNLMKTLEQETQVDKCDQKAEKLTVIHNRLAQLVSPAKPETIVLMADEKAKGSMFLFLGSVPLIRKMMVVAISSLIALIGLSLSAHVNNENMVASMFDMEGAELLFVQSILMASAAIGASFAALFKANVYVTAGSFDPKYESSYWVRFVVGLIAGIILTQLIPVNLNAVADAAGKAAGGQGGGGISHAALRITMALVGGFSANLVYKVLDRIVETVQSFISPVVVEDPQVIKDSLLNQFEREKQQFISELSVELNRIQQQLFADDQAISQKKIQNLLAGFQVFITSNERKN